MKSALTMNFSVDKENKTIKVEREFAAPVKTVWDAWTQSDILDKWWAPKPYVNKTKAMDFREGGRWLYSMTSPEGQVHWSLADYKEIKEGKSFSALDAFCDENGKVNTTEFPRSLWMNSFSQNGESTLVNIEIKYDKVEDLEKIITMGFKEGFTMGLDQLEELLEGNG